MACNFIMDSAFAKACVNRSSKNLSRDGLAWSNKQTPKCYNPPPKSRATVVLIPIIVPHELMKYVIGREGNVLKAITHKCEDVEYIWYDNLRHSIEIWVRYGGTSEDAVDLVNDRMLTIFYDKFVESSFDNIGSWGDVEE